MKIGIADSQARVRHGLSVLLDRQPGWQVVFGTTNALRLIEHMRTEPPDLLLLDCSLPGLPLADLLENLHQDCPDMLVIALSTRPELRQPVLQAGANAFSSKAEPPERLIQLIRQLVVI